MPKFSIIIPVYNVEPYLRECLDSVLAQTFSDWEAIVVDDGSADGSGMIADAFATRDSRFKVVHQANQGVSTARNTGIDMATGEWLLFLDGDDLIAPEALQTLADVVASHPAIGLIRFAYGVFEDGKGWGGGSCDGRMVEEKHIAKCIPMSDFFTYVWQHLYRRDVVGTRRFPRYKRGEDRVFIDGVLLYDVDSFAETQAVLYGYRQRETSAMHKAPTTQVLLDEMSHRRDIVLMIEKSRKTVNYAGSGWLEGYFIYAAWTLAARKDKADRKILHDEWFRQICQMADAKGISRFARFVFRTCRKFPCVPTWWCLCRLFPLYIHYGIIPRSRRGARRLVNHYGRKIST